MTLQSDEPSPSKNSQTLDASGAAGSTMTVWDNADLAEGLQKTTTPLTFSFASYASYHLFWQFCRMLGVPTPYLEQRREFFNGMLGFVRGRIYCNVNHWHRIASMLPWLDADSDQALGLLGARRLRETLKNTRPSLHASKRPFAKLCKSLHKRPRYSRWYRIRLAVITLWRFLHLEDLVSHFTEHYQSIYQWSKSIDFRNRSLQDQLAAYRYLDRQLLRQWTTPLINDAFYFAFFGLLKRLNMRWLRLSESQSVALQTDLLSGQSDLQSIEPTQMLMHIAQWVDTEAPEIKMWLLTHPSQQLLEDMQHLDSVRPFKEKLDEFIQIYGFRCSDELKLEAIDLHMDPTFAIKTVIHYVRAQAYKRFASVQKNQQQTRREAIDKVHKAIPSRLKRWTYFRILQYLTQSDRHREQLHLLRAQSVGIFRHLFLAMGANLAKIGAIATERDVFYLTKNEIFDYINGSALLADFRNLIENRQQEFKKYSETKDPPARFVTYGAASAAMASLEELEANALSPEPAQQDQAQSLAGVPCSPGIVEGPIRVARSLEEAQDVNDEILVAEFTDLAWLPLYPTCRGLLVERDTIFSHTSATVRDIGLPTIVSVEGLMQKMKTGMWVRMNGVTGEVTILQDTHRAYT